MITISKLKNGYLVNQKEIIEHGPILKGTEFLSCSERNALIQFIHSENRNLKINSSVYPDSVKKHHLSNH